MLSYSQIVKTSYILTVKNPLLWLFGLVAVGGFNLNFLFLQDLPLRVLRGQAAWNEVSDFLLAHTATLIVLAALSLFILFGLLVLANLGRIMLTLLSRKLLDHKPASILEELKQSRRLLWPVTKVSLLNSALMFIVATGLLGVPYWLVRHPESQSTLWTVGLMFLVPLAFTIASINIFSAFFITLFNQPWGKALNQATDFFVANWNKVLGLSAVLAVLYFASFAAGLGLIYIVRALGNAVLLYGGQYVFLKFSAIMLVSKGLTGIFLWALLAGLNVFFNTTLLLLFLQLTTPVESGLREEKEMLASPASSSV